MAPLWWNASAASLAANRQAHASAARSAANSAATQRPQRQAASTAAVAQPCRRPTPSKKTAPPTPQTARSGLASSQRAPAPAIAAHIPWMPCPGPGSSPPGPGLMNATRSRVVAARTRSRVCVLICEAFLIGLSENVKTACLNFLYAKTTCVNFCVSVKRSRCVLLHCARICCDLCEPNVK